MQIVKAIRLFSVSGISNLRGSPTTANNFLFSSAFCIRLFLVVWAETRGHSYTRPGILSAYGSGKANEFAKQDKIIVNLSRCRILHGEWVWIQLKNVLN